MKTEIIHSEKGDLSYYKMDNEIISASSEKILNDFIYESNKTGQVVFTKSIEEAIRLLK